MHTHTHVHSDTYIQIQTVGVTLFLDLTGPIRLLVLPYSPLCPSSYDQRRCRRYVTTRWPSAKQKGTIQSPVSISNKVSIILIQTDQWE